MKFDYFVDFERYGDELVANGKYDWVLEKNRIVLLKNQSLVKMEYKVSQ